MNKKHLTYYEEIYQRGYQKGYRAGRKWKMYIVRRPTIMGQTGLEGWGHGGAILRDK